MFCSNCGTPMAYESDKYPGEINLYLASLEDPSTPTPQFHVHCAEKLSWIVIADELAHHAHHSPQSLIDTSTSLANGTDT
jgi:hypothetical protein